VPTHRPYWKARQATQIKIALGKTCSQIGGRSLQHQRNRKKPVVDKNKGEITEVNKKLIPKTRQGANVTGKSKQELSERKGHHTARVTARGESTPPDNGPEGEQDGAREKPAGRSTQIGKKNMTDGTFERPRQRYVPCRTLGGGGEKRKLSR